MMKSVQLSPSDQARLQRSHDALAARAAAHRDQHGEDDHDYLALTALAEWATSAPVAVIDLRRVLDVLEGR